MAQKEDVVVDYTAHDYLAIVQGDHDLYQHDWVEYEVLGDRLVMTVHHKFEDDESFSWLLVPVAT